MTDRNDIEATDLVGVRSLDGERLRLRLRDRSGQTVTVVLPARSLHAMWTALPWPQQGAVVHPLASWSIDRPQNGGDLLLTLRTAEGHAATFAVKSWQAQAMATIAAQGNPDGNGKKTIH